MSYGVFNVQIFIISQQLLMPKIQSHLNEEFDEERLHLSNLSATFRKSHADLKTTKTKIKFGILMLVLAICGVVYMIMKSKFSEVQRRNGIALENDPPKLKTPQKQPQKQPQIEFKPVVIKDDKHVIIKDDSKDDNLVQIKKKIDEGLKLIEKEKPPPPPSPPSQQGHQPKKLSNKTTSKSPKQFLRHLLLRKKKFLARKQLYAQRFAHRLASGMRKGANITYEQFITAVDLMSYTGQIQSDLNIKKTYQKQRDAYQLKYKISAYKEKPMCIVVPTYNNINNFRYYYNIDSIMTQNYSNFHAIFINDNSQDGTGEAIQDYLIKRSIKQQKALLITNKQRKFHMQNIYNAIHGYCKSGEIVFIIDGDDQLIGRHVFQLFNAVYYQTNAYSAYSNHLRVARESTMDIGISQAYPQEIKEANSYRVDLKHYYSHLRSFVADLFFNADVDSFKNSQGRWFNNSVDNAIFFSVFQMSCQRVEYIPEITYKYNTATGLNYATTWKTEIRKRTAEEIKKKKVYNCIEDKGKGKQKSTEGAVSSPSPSSSSSSSPSSSSSSSSFTLPTSPTLLTITP